MQTSVNPAAFARKGRVPTTLPTQVLIIDDDPDYLDLLMNAIGQIEGVQVELARTPEDAVRLMSHGHYELIVSDWALDQSTAPEVLLRADSLKSAGDDSKTPVLFISGSEKVGQTQVLRTLRHFEAVSFVLKRCGPPLISLLVEHILSHFHSPDPEKAC